VRMALLGACEATQRYRRGCHEHGDRREGSDRRYQRPNKADPGARGEISERLNRRKGSEG
jgi:hypothetical protein